MKIKYSKPRKIKFKHNYLLSKDTNDVVSDFDTSFQGKAIRQEIRRRISTVKQALIDLLLASGGDSVSGNEVITHLNVLLQQPTIVIIYKIKAGRYVYQKHFDYRKAKESRGSLSLKVKNKGVWKEFDPDVSHEVSDSVMFRVARTDFYLRIFVLDTTKDDQPFFELSRLKVDSKKIQSGLQWAAYEYCRMCAIGLLSFDESEIDHYGSVFVEVLEDKLERIFCEHHYVTSQENSTPRRKQTLLSTMDKSNVEALVNTRNRYALGEDGAIDHIYTHSAFASKLLKTFGVKDLQYKSSIEMIFPNLFLSLRTYDRDKARAERCLDDGTEFRGYAHNVSFVIPSKQRKDMEKYLLRLRTQGSKGYINGENGIKNECYGHKWDFESKPGYANFASTLDREFWKLLSINRMGFVGVNAILDILSSPVGSESTSMVDAVFYYGSSLYRMPFRRLGGLGRLHGLESVYTNLPESERHAFGFEHIRGEKHAELRRDCLRVVAFFYITRMLGPICYEQAKCYTKIHLYPIDVGGAVVGTIGKVSYQPKDSRLGELPTPNEAWNQEFHFYSNVVLSAQNDFRHQYKQFQIEKICESFGEALKNLIEEAYMDVGTYITLEIQEKFISRINSTSQQIARICPYDAYEFSIDLPNLHTFISDRVRCKNVVPVAMLFEIVFNENRSWNVFRSLQPYGESYSADEKLSMLRTKLGERVGVVLDQTAYLRNQTAYSANAGSYFPVTIN